MNTLFFFTDWQTVVYLIDGVYIGGFLSIGMQILFAVSLYQKMAVLFLLVNENLHLSPTRFHGPPLPQLDILRTFINTKAFAHEKVLIVKILTIKIVILCFRILDSDQSICL